MLSEQHRALSNLPLKPKEKDYFKKVNPEFVVNVTKRASCSIMYEDYWYNEINAAKQEKLRLTANIVIVLIP
jgi:hypothetical protein